MRWNTSTFHGESHLVRNSAIVLIASAAIALILL
jgi:hypothetical protein